MEEMEEKVRIRIEAKLLPRSEPAPSLDVEKVQEIIANDLDLYNVHVMELIEKHMKIKDDDRSSHATNEAAIWEARSFFSCCTCLQDLD